MFVDACAIVSIFAGEESAAGCGKALAKAEAPSTSALAVWEAIIVLSRPDQLNCAFLDTHAVVTEWLALRSIELRETTSPSDVLRYAVEVAQGHGIGKRALSNFDCFHYAWAKAMGVPLLTMDALLRKTDIPTLPETH